MPLPVWMRSGKILEIDYTLWEAIEKDSTQLQSIGSGGFASNGATIMPNKSKLSIIIEVILWKKKCI